MPDLPDKLACAKEDSYEVLREAGHSPLKAAQIILDAQRGDEFSKMWIANLRALQKGNGQ